ncbi:MAG: FHA domain-containing protein [Lachnospiraceae bacterium]|nr:FHA domain-containing protein [Lachnospiraceae bacterium]
MAVMECPNGHLYDSDIYSECPYCSGGSQSNEILFGGAGGGTAPVAGGFGPSSGEDAYKTSIGGGAGSKDNYKTSIGAVNMGDNNKTVAPGSFRDAEKKSGRTEAIIERKMGVQPVTGWIVCIEGKNKGKSYNLYDKQNTIGRNSENDVCIEGDNTISRDNHARIAYDSRHNAFTLIAKESINNIYLNNEPVYIPTKLEAFDTIELGESKFKFVPFCCDQFSWK